MSDPTKRSSPIDPNDPRNAGILLAEIEERLCQIMQKKAVERGTPSATRERYPASSAEPVEEDFDELEGEVDHEEPEEAEDSQEVREAMEVLRRMHAESEAALDWSPETPARPSFRLDFRELAMALDRANGVLQPIKDFVIELDPQKASHRYSLSLARFLVTLRHALPPLQKATLEERKRIGAS